MAIYYHMDSYDENYNMNDTIKVHIGTSNIIF